MKPAIMFLVFGLAVESLALPVFGPPHSAAEQEKQPKFRIDLDRYKVYPERIEELPAPHKPKSWDAMASEYRRTSQGRCDFYSWLSDPAIDGPVTTTGETPYAHSKPRTGWYFLLHIPPVSYRSSRLPKVADGAFLCLMFISFVLFLAARFLPERNEGEASIEQPLPTCRRVLRGSPKYQWQFDEKHATSGRTLE